MAKHCEQSIRVARLFLWAIVLLTWMLFSSCSTHHKNSQSRHIPPPGIDTTPHNTSATAAFNHLKIKRNTVLQNAIDSIGTPYRWGGTSPARGLDCSGLIVYSHQAAGIRIPRTAKDQMRQGRPVFKQHLQPADLVFFNTAGKATNIHVGLYAGDGMFLHSPGKGRQVTWASLDNPYFKSRFIGARTYISPQT